MKGMRIINPDALHRTFEEMKQGKFATIENTDFEIRASDTEPIDGYEVPEGFPDCCDHHRHAHQNAMQTINKFPNCCEEHKSLLNANWFRVGDYKTMPDKVLKKLSYTEHAITTLIDTADWFDDICGYLQYSYQSFGQFPPGYGHPLGIDIYHSYIRFWLSSGETFIEEKKERLLRYMDNYFNPKEHSQIPDINQLIDTYRRWLKVFPFDLTFFKDIKLHFESSLPPLLKGTPVYNKYSKQSTDKVVSKGELISFLISMTKTLLRKINTTELFENLTNSEAKKQSIELIGEDLRIKNELLLGEYTTGEIEYMRVLKKWLTYQKEYFRDIKAVMNKDEPQKAANDPLSLSEISECENKFWKGIPMQAVVQHFKVLAERKSKNGKPFLTDQQLIKFLQKGFLGINETPKQSINLSNGEKGFVIKRFYEFFDLAVAQYGEVNKKYKYIKLMSDCFANWNESSIEPFFKPNKTKENW